MLKTVRDLVSKESNLLRRKTLWIQIGKTSRREQGWQNKTKVTKVAARVVAKRPAAGKVAAAVRKATKVVAAVRAAAARVVARAVVVSAAAAAATAN